MASSFNKVHLLGNITRDLELRYLQSGTALLDFGIAVNEKRKNQAGDWIEETSFIDIVCFGRTAEIVSQYLGKGSPILLAGKLKQDRWENDGQKRSKVKVIANEVTLLPRGGGGQQRSEYSEPSSGEEPDPEQQPMDDSDVPF